MQTIALRKIVVGRPARRGWRARGVGQALALAATIALGVPAIAAIDGKEIGTAEVVVNEVYGRNINRRLEPGSKVVFRERIRTGVASATELEFLDETRLKMGASSEVLLDDLIYDPERSTIDGALEMLRGVMRFTSIQTGLNIDVRVPAATIGIRGTEVDVMAKQRSTEVAVRRGMVDVDTGRANHIVRAGEVLRVGADGQTERSDTPSAMMAAAVAEMDSLVASKRAAASEPAATAGADKEDVRTAVAGRDPENVLVMQLARGPVVIEMRPDLAPQHVARIRELARDGFYDNLTFHSVSPGYAAETGDPTGTGRGGSGRTLAAELSAERFGRGTVGMTHYRDRPDSADSQFFIIFAPTPALDGQYTVWGQVISGMEHLEKLRGGRPPRPAERLESLDVAADLLAGDAASAQATADPR